MARGQFRPLCLLSCVFTIVSLNLSSDVMLEGQQPPGEPPSVNVSYNDTRPPAPNGYLCVYGAKGRLNNLILQNLVGLYLAHRVNRTLLVDEEVARYYDIDRLSLMIYAESPHAAAVAISKSEHKACVNPTLLSPYKIDRTLKILERFDQYETQTRGRALAAVDNTDVWYWLGRPPEEIYGKFFRGLVPRRATQDKVHTFLQKHALLQPVTNFNAVHLRFFG